MDAFSDPSVREIAAVLASQVAKTECVNNMIGQRIHSNPGPMLLIQPTLKMAEAWSKDRLAPMLRDTPCLRGKVRDAKARNTGNTVLHKVFAGGHLTMAGANSPSSLAMRPIRDVFFDEEDRYPASAGTEGDPVKLAVTRTRAFWNSKVVHISSPGVRGASRIEMAWNRSDQRLYYVPCHECGAMQVLRWAQVHWDKDEASGEPRPTTARYVCEACGAAWSDLQRRAAVRHGEWRATRPFTGCAGFHVSALAAPWESTSLTSLVTQFLEAQGNPNLLQVFVNTVLAEWWESSHFSKTIDETGLMARREALEHHDGRLTVPAACAVLTAGVDVQDNRFEITVKGFGAGEESWVLAHHVIFGDPTTKQGEVLSAAWQLLDAWLLAPFKRELGGVEYIRAICVDTGGHHTQTAYEFCTNRYLRHTPDGGTQFVFATKGTAGAGDLWPKAPSKYTTKVPLWPLRVDAGKGQIYGRLGIADPGPGYIHLPDVVGIEYLRGLCSERCEQVVDKKGFVRLVWKLKRSGLSNEPLDCMVLALAALAGLRSNGFDLERAVADIPVRVVFDPQPSSGAVEAPVVPHQNQPRARVQPGWLGDTTDWLRRQS